MLAEADELGNFVAAAAEHAIDIVHDVADIAVADEEHLSSNFVSSDLHYKPWTWSNQFEICLATLNLMDRDVTYLECCDTHKTRALLVASNCVKNNLRTDSSKDIGFY